MWYGDAASPIRVMGPVGPLQQCPGSTAFHCTEKATNCDLEMESSGQKEGTA